LRPVVCVGESLEDREAGRTEEVIARQVGGSLEGLTPEQAARIALAYEPVWAIGTGRTASPETANEVHVLIRGLLSGILGSSSAGALRVLYGGSVKPDNAAGLMSQSDIDGVLVGGASLDPAGFAEIAAAAR
jgi:triosephosphate isomerase